MKFLNTLFILAACLGASIAEPLTNYGACSDADTSMCKIENLSLTPCPEASTGQPCKLKKGSTATIKFDYIPNFSAETLQQRAYSSSIIDLPMPGFQTDGCKSTSCPITAGQTYPYSYDLYLSSAFPTSTYKVKWRVWNPQEESQECCVVFRIKLN